MTTDAHGDHDLRVADTVDHSEIRRLIDTYADVVSRRDWPALDTLFAPDARVELDLRRHTHTLTGATEVGAFIAPAVDRFEFFQFVVLGVTVGLRSDGDPDRASGRTYMSELRQDSDSHRWSQILGVYHDRFIRTEHGWSFAHRYYHSMARRFEGETSAEVFPFPDRFRLETYARDPGRTS